MKIFAYLQKVGKSLMMPVAVLPAAALFLRFGSADLLGQFMGGDNNVLRKVGEIAFAQMPLIFAAGVAIGISDDGHGAAVLAAILSFFTLNVVGEQWAKTIWSDFSGKWDIGTLGGITAGIIAGEMYNRFKNFQLPEILSFFAAKRFVPMVTLALSFFVAAIFGLVWPSLQNGVSSFYQLIQSTPNFVQGGVHVTTERLLIPFGLHHIWNAIVLFADPGGDAFRFFKGEAGSGVMMVGKFVLNMFALPAVAFAMISTAKPEKRNETKSIMITGILITFVTGITEPIEFLFLWVAPLLYIYYAFLAGIFGAITSATGALHGFGFSASLIDFILNYGISTNPWYPMLIGVVSVPVFYFSFRYLILKFDIKTPGRGDDDDDDSSTSKTSFAKKGDYLAKSQSILEALGGTANVVEATSCATRIRLTLVDSSKINVKLAKSAGVIEVTKPSKTSAQLIIGPTVQFYMNEFSKLIKK